MVEGSGDSSSIICVKDGDVEVEREVIEEVGDF